MIRETNRPTKEELIYKLCPSEILNDEKLFMIFKCGFNKAWSYKNVEVRGWKSWGKLWKYKFKNNLFNCNICKDTNADCKIIPIEELDISLRCNTLLKQLNIKYLNQLSNYSKEDLYKIKNFGKRSIQELDEFMYENGLSWKS